MKIVYLDSSAQLGGAERVLLDVLAGVRAARPSWPLTLIAPGDGPLPGAARRLGVQVELSPWPVRLASSGDYAFGWMAAGKAIPSTLRYAARLRARLRAIGPDLIHSNGFKMHVASAWTKPPGARLVWHLHDYVSRRPRSAALMRRSAAACDAIVANSQSVADDAAMALRSPVTPKAILNGVDLKRFSPEGAVASLDQIDDCEPAPLGVVRVGLVATYGRWKGHLTFLRAIAALPVDLPIRAYIVGGPIYETTGSQYSRAELEAEAARLNIGSRVRFVDFAPEPANVFRALDVVVHASTEPEPFGLVIAEAMACARAVVAADAGGAAEMLVPDANALAHRPGDVAGLGAAIVRLVKDPLLRRRLGVAARRTAEQRLDSARVVSEVCGVYEGLAQPLLPGQTQQVPA